MKNRIMLILMAALLCVLLLPAMASADQASYGEPLTDENGDVYDLGGMEIIVRDWWSPAEPADPVNEYERARQDYINWIQQTYNFKIRQVGLSSRDSAVIDFLEYAQSDPDENNYIFVLYNDPALVAAMRTGLAWDLKELDCLCFDDEKFWRNGTHEMYSISGHTYAMAAGDPEPGVGIFFNKRLLKDAGLDPDQIYDLQANGTWNWDSLIGMLRLVHRDTDGDGRIDVFGANGAFQSLVAAAVFSNDGEFVGKNDAGEYRYKLDDPKTTEALEWAVDLMDHYWQNDPEDQSPDYYMDAFKNAEFVFLFEDPSAARRGNYLFDENDNFDNFGFVMFPKGPQSVDCTNCWNSSPVVIPKNYDKDRAWKIAFAWDLFTNDPPGWEDNDSWKDDWYDGFSDTRAVDESLAMMLRKGSVTYHDMIPGIEFGPQFADNIRPGSDVSEMISHVEDTWKGYIDAANGKDAASPPSVPSAGAKTIKNFLLGALQPVGKVLYVWGGGWNDATRKGLSQTMTKWFNSQSSSYDYHYYNDLSATNRARGFDCAGYLGWAAYQVMHANSNEGGGYTRVSGEIGNFYKTLGWGNTFDQNYLSNQNYQLKAGDIGYNDGGCWIVVGQCKDKSAVILHASPQAGVQIAGTATPSGSYESEAVVLAKSYMAKYYPNSLRKYEYHTSCGNYIPRYNYFRWNRATLADPDGYMNKYADAILADLFASFDSTPGAEPHACYADCSAPTICVVCGAEIPEDPDTMTHEIELQVDGEYHRFCCACRTYDDGPELHWASCADPGYCAVCGAKTNAEPQHETVFVSSDEHADHFACPCGQERKDEPHTDHCDDPGTCIYCLQTEADGIVIGEHCHVAKDEVEYVDGETHRQVCVCGEQQWSFPHMIACGDDSSTCMECGHSVPDAAILHDYRLRQAPEGCYFACATCGDIQVQLRHYTDCTDPDADVCAFCGYPLAQATTYETGLHSARIDNVTKSGSVYYHEAHCMDCGQTVYAKHRCDIRVERMDSEDLHALVCSSDGYVVTLEDHRWTRDTESGQVVCADCGQVCTDPVFTVSFDTDGGSAVEEQLVKEGGHAVSPDPSPTKNGYNFMGWYQADKMTPFDFKSTAIDADTTVYAVWTEKSSRSGGGSSAAADEGGAAGHDAAGAEDPAGATAAAILADDTFVDVAADDYFAAAVGWALAGGITNGMDETHFSPYSDCTRGQMVTFLWRAAGCPEPQITDDPFKDVDEEDYYYKAVLWAAEQGITKGTAADAFSPDDPVSCAQTVTFLYRTFGGGSEEDAESEAYYEAAVRWAGENGITLASDPDAFSPEADCLRAQIITFLWRACTKR